ncbi:MAG TPA: ATP-dependent RecD-like DNA helicase [Oligoflexia bacterium]|nr:ATP-dependent RecD-like DNA helicase [Oligoflexia bacterium]HMP26447.1 ATP-dependent RecD-like DNA helicase [Oligoflexia bacterium]
MKSDIKENIIVKGSVSRITFHNPQNGYVVLQVAAEPTEAITTVVGNWASPKIGAQIYANGKQKHHPKFGLQLEAVSITEVAPSSTEGVIKFLGSGFIKGIGPATAEKIVAKFGARSVEIARLEPAKIAAIPGVGKARAKALSESLNADQQRQTIFQFLSEKGISLLLADKIIKRFGNQTIEIVSKDPYLLARHISGIGFQIADEIARGVGISLDAPVRLKAGICYALEQALDDGHCFLGKDQLLRKAQNILRLESDSSCLEELLAVLGKEGAIVIDQARYYLPQIYRAEKSLAELIEVKVNHLKENKISNAVIDQSIKIAARELKISFSQEQIEAVQTAAAENLLIITGGPGCGKTTIIRAICELFKRADKKLLLAAPTGRAAQRMSQVCEQSASTIHRLLRYDPFRGSFIHNISNPLEADCIIVDESSMIDLMLARDLFAATARDCLLVLVGDKDQLPSVGPGRVFADLIATGKIKVVSLKKLFRRSEESRINSVAHSINAGEIPYIPQPDGETKSDAYFLPRSEAVDAAELIEKLVADQIPKKFNFKPREITVLTPGNRGIVGTVELNKRLQARLNPAKGDDFELAIGETGNVFRLGDRVCQRTNNYNIDEYGVFNGDLGEVVELSREQRALTVELWDGRLIRYEAKDINQLSLAYAVTVHRSQGSEIPCVVLVLDESHYTLLERQLIYTGVTRAKKLLIVVGSKRALALSARRTNAAKRQTTLVEMIMLMEK